MFAEPFPDIFGLSGETKWLCISAMRIISISFVFAEIFSVLVSVIFMKRVNRNKILVMR